MPSYGQAGTSCTLLIVGSIGPGELLILCLLALAAFGVIRWVAATTRRGAARAARLRDQAGAGPSPAVREAPQIVDREKVIERQIIVAHCKYCQELTPVDLSKCKSCGATLR